MEKLIELLNEYQKENKRQFFYSYNRDLDFFESGTIGGTQTYGESLYIVISKKFGFIQWLVENDKIDRLKIDFECDIAYIDLTDKVLMLLSISSSPIEDLISYLK